MINVILNAYYINVDCCLIIDIIKKIKWEWFININYLQNKLNINLGSIVFSPNVQHKHRCNEQQRHH